MIHASLFSGIGGPEVAASMMGWENAFHCEINPFGRRILDYHFPESESYEDITKTDFRKWTGKIDVLTGGFPCQPFSVSGRRKGADDDRYLWPQFIRVIQEIRPTWVVGENVAGILSMVQPGETVDLGRSSSIFGEGYEERETRQQYVVETICRDLEQAGYSVQPFLIPACAVGAPHRRDRIFFVAHSQCRGRHELDNYIQPEKPNGERSYMQGSERNASNTYGAGLQETGTEKSPTGASRNRHRHASDTESKQSERCEPEQRESRKQEQGKSGGICRKDGDKCSWEENFWKGFPATEPTIRRGDDGISKGLDGITFPKWRQESIKAYGNAIVPQVMYEIFRAIEIVENEINESDKI